MFENIMNFFRKLSKKEKNKESSSAAKERLHLVLMQDRANVSADFLELMRQEIIEVIKKYIDIDEKAIDVKLTNKMNEDGTVGAPALYANIPIVTIKNEARKVESEIQAAKVENNPDLNKDKNEKKKETIKEKAENVEGKKETNQELKAEEQSNEIEKTEQVVEEEKIAKEKEQEHTEKQEKESKKEEAQAN